MKTFLPDYQLLERGPLAIAISRLSDGQMLYASEAFLRLTGYTREEMEGRTAQTLQLWANAGERARMVEAVLAQGFKYNLAIDLRRKSGEVIQVLGNALTIDMEGEPHILTLLNDLRDMDGELAVHAAERKHMDFVEAAGKMGFWHFDEVCSVLHWSHGMEVIFGIPKGEFKGTADDFFRRIHPDDLARSRDECGRAIASRQPFDVRFRILRTDGAVRWVVSRGAARCKADGRFLGVAGILLDITDEVAREQQMRLQAHVMQNMAEGVAMVSMETGCFIYLNPRFENILGYAPGQLLGQPVSVINTGSEAERQAVAMDIIDQMHAHGEWRGELKNRCADGREIWISATVSELVHDGFGKVWVSVHADINERRLAQDARDKALTQLRRLSLNIQDSIEAERLAVSRDVHDQLGAAMTGMRMKLESMAATLQAGGQVAPAALLALAGTARNTQLAARDICTRLRPQILDDVSLSDACRWYLADWSQQVGIGVRGRFNRPAKEPHARLATDLFRVMQELLTNVARHSGARQVRLILCLGPAACTLRLRDDGHGFATAQAHSGFGLMGVDERVRQHKGRFTLHSGASGTVVTVTLRQEAGA